MTTNHIVKIIGELFDLNADQINTEIKINEYTNPITIPGGFLILKLNEKRTTKRKIEFEEELNKIIKIKTNEQLNQFSNIFLNKIKKDVIINEL